MQFGGGAQDCAVKTCNFKKNYDGCWQCPKYKICKKLDALNSLHGVAHRKNLENIEKKELLILWTVETGKVLSK
jgi:hypothetical protein